MQDPEPPQKKNKSIGEGMSEDNFQVFLSRVLGKHPKFQEVLAQCLDDGYEDESDLIGLPDDELARLGFRKGDINRLRRAKESPAKTEVTGAASPAERKEHVEVKKDDKFASVRKNGRKIRHGEDETNDEVTEIEWTMRSFLVHISQKNVSEDHVRSFEALIDKHIPAAHLGPEVADVTRLLAHFGCVVFSEKNGEEPKLNLKTGSLEELKEECRRQKGSWESHETDKNQIDAWTKLEKEVAKMSKQSSLEKLETLAFGQVGTWMNFLDDIKDKDLSHALTSWRDYIPKATKNNPAVVDGVDVQDFLGRIGEPNSDEYESGCVKIKDSPMGDGLFGYAKNKAKALYAMQVLKLPLIVLGLWQPLFTKEFAESHNWTILESGLFVDGAAKKLTFAYNCDPPTLHKVDLGGARGHALVMVVPIGCDYVSCIAKAHRLLLDQDPELKNLSVTGMYYPQLLEPKMYLEWTGLKSYLAKTVDLDVLSGVSVVLGRPGKLLEQMRKTVVDWRIDRGDLMSPQHPHFGCQYVVPSNTDKGSRILFLGVRSSFWGDISVALAKSVLKDLNAKEILHCGVKVGTFSLRWVRGLAIAPREFYLWKDGQIKPVAAINTLVTNAEKGTRAHLSLPNPLDENKTAEDDWKARYGLHSVDDEGSYMAQVALEENKFFGAIYYGSNYILAYHERELPSAGALDDNLSEEDKNNVERNRSTVASNLFEYFRILHAVEGFQQAFMQQKKWFYDNFFETALIGGKKIETSLLIPRTIARWREHSRPGEKDTNAVTVSLQSLLEMSETEPVVLVGSKGDGKSTYLKMFAKEHYLKVVDGASKDLVLYVPVMERWKNMDHSKTFDAFDLVGLDLRRLVEQGKTIVWLFDEVDQISDSKDHEKLKAFMNQVFDGEAQYVTCSVVATLVDRMNFGTHSPKATVELVPFTKSDKATLCQVLGKGHLKDSKSMASLGISPTMVQLVCRNEAMLDSPNVHDSISFLEELLKNVNGASYDDEVSLLERKGLRTGVTESFLRARWFLRNKDEKSKLSSFEWSVALRLEPQRAAALRTLFCQINDEDDMKALLNSGLFDSKDVRAHWTKDAELAGADKLSPVDQIQAYASLASLLSLSGDSKLCLEAAKKGMNIFEASGIDDMKLHIRLIMVIAWSSHYARAKGEVVIPYLEKGLLFLEKVKDTREWSKSVGRLLTLKGRMLQRKSIYEQSRTALEDALKVLERFYQFSEEYIEALKELGWTERGMGEDCANDGKIDDAREWYAKAEVHLRESQERRLHSVGRDASYGTILRQLGSLKRDFADLETNREQRDALLVESENLYREAYSIKEPLMPVEHPELATIDHELAKVLGYRGAEFYPEAKKLTKRALESRLQVLGPDDPNTARTYHAFAVLEIQHDEQNLRDRATDMARKALEIYNKIGEDTRNKRELEKFIKDYNLEV